MREVLTLSIADYAIFSLMLAVSAGIGLYFLICGKKQTTNHEYVLAGRDMPIFPVAFSLMATFMSSTTLMGIPAEMYIYGTNMAFMNVGFLLGAVIASYVFLPIYFKAGISTAYEYLERRFGKSTRALMSTIFLFQNVLFNSVSVYAPALALSAVTNLSMWTSVISIGAVCTFYCTLGGMKAVLWTDVFQSFLMYTCLLVVIIKGCLDLGGLQNIFETAYEGGRIVLPTLKMDFSRQYTLWNVLIQGIILTTYVYGTTQTQIQRQLTLRNVKRSRTALLLSSPMLIAFQLLCCVSGLVIYAYFKTCDPMSSPAKPIHSADQLMPYYITSAMSQYPGLPGLCIAGIFSASLSTISSTVNAMAAVTYEDIIRPIWPNPAVSVWITRIASIIYGVLCILLAFLVASVGTLVKANILIVGIISGPTLGVYLLAVFTRRTNEMGVNLGVLSGFIFAGWAAFISTGRFYPRLPVEKNCSQSLDSMLNFSAPIDHVSVNATDLTSSVSTIDVVTDPFPLSYMWISPISLLVCITIGYLGSWIYTCISGHSKVISPDLLSPILQRFGKKDSETKKVLPMKEVSEDLTITNCNGIN